MNPIRLSLASLIISVAAILNACAPATWNQDVKKGLDVVEVVCLLDHAFLPALPEPTAAELAQVCGVAEKYIPDVEKLLEANKKAVLRARVK